MSDKPKPNDTEELTEEETRKLAAEILGLDPRQQPDSESPSDVAERILRS